MTRDVRKFGISDKRGRVKTSVDPYLDEQGQKEPAICDQCQALYRNKRWSLDPAASTAIKDGGDYHAVTCPACQKIAEGYPEGIVTLRGGYLWEHEEEVRNLLRNEENKAMANNPLGRVIGIKREGDDLIIETTEEKLAEHFGRALHKAHQGELKVIWSDDHAVCRVNWERSA
jgi:NMD protein affecting ribosome stability and mRNA decay